MDIMQNADPMQNTDPMLDMFIYETNQLIEQLDEILLNVEKNNNLCTEGINKIFRIMHTIKGTAAMMMFENIAAAAHSIEDLFYYIREKQLNTADFSGVCDLVLEASDFIKDEVLKINEGLNDRGSEKTLTTKLKDYLGQLTNQFGEYKKEFTEEQKERFYITPKKFVKEVKGYKAQVFFQEDCEMENIRAFSLVHSINEFCSELHYWPSKLIEDSSTCKIIQKSGFSMYFKSGEAYEDIYNQFEQAMLIKNFQLNVVEDFEALVKNISAEKTTHKSSSVFSPKDVSKPFRQNMISVNISKVDKLFDLVNEIAITQDVIANHQNIKDLEQDSVYQSVKQLKQLTDELQDVIISIRVMPMAVIFHKVKRIVRDMGKKLDKQVELTIEGEDTEIDKNIIDKLTDPIIHIIRNAMDHGIEGAKERISKHKPENGKICVSVKNIERTIVVTVSDDGAGVNEERILEKAREKGLIDKSQHEVTDEEIYSLLMLPGLTTTENVTEYSGRGVGMDVVKQNIDMIGGSISIDSKKDKGTTVTITIPLMLSNIDDYQMLKGEST